ncbi:MAG: glutaminase A [Gammaproteobacteria bacterium]|nr:glutaminase A [Gammaproteobacteria bacterium]
MISPDNRTRIQSILNDALTNAMKNNSGQCATYIPELANVDLEMTMAAITFRDGETLTAGENQDYRFTLQSVAKLILLAGLLEEYGESDVFSWVGCESSGHDFSNIVQLESFGPKPSNPCVNAGAIALCNHIPGDTVAKQLAWIDQWMERLFGEPLRINQSVFESERTTGYRNFALANLMKSNGVITKDVNDVLRLYFSLCSYEATIIQTSRFSSMLANGGVNFQGKRVLTKRSVRGVVSTMATCGLYDESGRHLLRTGLPAKSGVSGLIIATAVGLGGISVFNPRLNPKGGSVRGHSMLEYLSAKLGWHFATPRKLKSIKT